MKKTAHKILLIRKDIEEIRAYKTQGAAMRSHALWVEQGEKMTKYFFNLEKSNSSRKVINKLVVDDQLIDSNQEIIDE